MSNQTPANKIYDDVNRGEIDLGIVSSASKQPSLFVNPFREDRLVLVCAMMHPFAKFSKVWIQKTHKA